MRKLLSLLIMWVMLGLVTTSTWAASPDGASGPYADVVVSFNQGNRKDGSSVISGVSNSSEALGAPDDAYVALGFGGTLVLKFDSAKAITSSVQINEVSPGGDLALESVAVYMSRDGSTWYYADTENRSGSVDLPDDLTCAVYVKLVDATNPASHSDSADGYDVDSVEAESSGYCQELVAPTTAPTPAPTQTPTLTPTTAPTNNPQNPNPTTIPTPTGVSNNSSATPSTDPDLNDATMTLAASGPTCTERDFYTEAVLKRGNEYQKNVLVKFTYLGASKTATTNDDGKAAITLSYSGVGEVKVEADGYPTKTFTVNQLVCNGEVLGTTTSSDSNNGVGGRVLGATTERLAATGTNGYVQLFLITAAITSGSAYVIMKKYSI
jgi:hypothetical protein